MRNYYKIGYKTLITHCDSCNQDIRTRWSFKKNGHSGYCNQCGAPMEFSETDVVGFFAKRN